MAQASADVARMMSNSAWQIPGAPGLQRKNVPRGRLTPNLPAVDRKLWAISATCCGF